MKRTTKKQANSFRRTMSECLASIGARQRTEADPYLGVLLVKYEYILPTRFGPLHISIYDDWLACRFEDVQRAVDGGVDCNRYSGKWNHWADRYEPGMGIPRIVERLRAILPEAPDLLPKGQEL